jgi:hypothetical protein
MAAQLDNNNVVERVTKKPRIRTLFKVMLVVVFAWRVPSFREAIVDMHRYAQHARCVDKDVDLANRHDSQTSTTGLQQCEIPENHTTMDANWLRFVTKAKWMPAGGLKDGIFAPEWHPALDCPAAFKTLVWVDQAAGIVSCPPGAAMWTFYERSTSPALSSDSSQKVTCDDNGRHTIAPGWGLLRGNSLRLRPKRNVEAVDRAKRLLEKRQNEQKEKKLNHPPHILVYMLDAVSRPALCRSLKATRRSIEAVANRAPELGVNVFEFARHHSVGGNSIRNLTPMLTGLLFADMKAKKKKYEAWTFEEMRRSGYIVANTHNGCRQSNLTFGDGFKINSPDHFFPFQMHDIGYFESLHCQLSKGESSINIEQACAKTPDATECFASPENNMDRVSCLGGRSRATLMLEHFLHVRADHNEVPSFGFLHDYDLHVNNLVALNMYDEDKARIMPMLAEAGVLKDTVVIFLSDHGSQRTITTTTQGAIEYKLPFLHMFVPDAVLNTHSGWREALEFNQQVLTSPRDIHETIIDLAGGRGIGDDKWWEKHGYDPKLGGSSLLHPLEYNRSCADAGIPAIECLCGRAPMVRIKAGSRAWNTVLTDYLPKVVNYMNTELAIHNLTASVCRTLEVDSLLHATSRRSDVNMVAFETRFSIASPRTEPMEMLASFGVGSKELRGVTIDTIIQTSHFSHWVMHCGDEVTAAGGNDHFCDCAHVPDGGWESIRQTQ